MWLEELSWIYHVWSSIECVCCACGPSKRLDAPSICIVCVCWKCCCCLPTPMALASGGSPMFPLVVHQPASPSIWPAVQSPDGVCPQIQGRQCGAYVGAVEEMCVVCVDVTEGA